VPEKGRQLDAKEGIRMEGNLMINIVVATIWYLFITTIMAVLATAYNHLLNQDAERAIPVCFKVVAGVVATEILRVLGLQPLIIFAAIYMIDLLKLDGGITVALIVALVDVVWTINAILSYGAMGIPLIIGDMIRWANVRKRNQAAESSEHSEQELRKLIEKLLTRSGGNG